MHVVTVLGLVIIAVVPLLGAALSVVGAVALCAIALHVLALLDPAGELTRTARHDAIAHWLMHNRTVDGSKRRWLGSSVARAAHPAPLVPGLALGGHIQYKPQGFPRWGKR